MGCGSSCNKAYQNIDDGKGLGKGGDKLSQAATTPASVESFLAQVPLFFSLNEQDRQLVANACESGSYDSGSTVIKQGDLCKEFFLIMKGDASVIVEGVQGAQEKVASLKAGDYFGEHALLYDAPRAATIIAEGSAPLRTLSISRDKFQELKLNKKLMFPARKAVGGAKKLKNDNAKPPSPKTDQERVMITEAMKQNKNLTTMISMTPARCNGLIDLMWKETISPGTAVIKQGDSDCNLFYVVQDGEFEVIATESGKQPKTKTVQKVTKGGSFGELGLLYMAPRAATVKATTTSQVWVVDRTNFQRMLMVEDRPQRLEEYIVIINKVTFFNALLTEEREALARSLVEKTFKAEEVIVKQGELGQFMYILTDGDVDISKDGVAAPKLDKIGVFGEQALITKEPRAATVKAGANGAKTLVLDQANFNLLLGDYTNLIKRRTVAVKKQTQKREFGVIMRRDLNILGLLGCGGFGAVEMVEHKRTKEVYALKAVSKGYVVQSGMQENVINEKEILIMVNSIHIIKLYETYNGSQSLYFLMEVALGGELFATYGATNLYGSEPHAKFYCAGAILSFMYLHEQRIIYRDLKPENMMLTTTGRTKLVDMGLAKVVVGKTYTTCGTPDYFAPEIIEQTGHTFAVDWWCVGILAFELMSGSPPFEADTPMQTYEKIKKGINSVEFPKEMEGHCKNFITALCKDKPSKRLAVELGGPKNLQTHAWYKGFDWKAFDEQKMNPPYVPQIKHKKDMANFRANKAEKPAMVKYEDDGTGWDKDFATCDGGAHMGGRSMAPNASARE